MASYDSLYKTKEWKAIRAKRLYKEPKCRMCTLVGQQVKAWIVDHVKPHRGAPALFFDYENTQSLCETHHNSLKQADEIRGYSSLVGEDGWPTDPSHPFNASSKKHQELQAALSAFQAKGGKINRLDPGNAYGSDQLAKWQTARSGGQCLPGKKRLRSDDC